MKLLVWNGLRFTNWEKDSEGDYMTRICEDAVKKYNIPAWCLDGDIDEGKCALYECDNHGEHDADYWLDMCASSVQFVDSETGKIVAE